LLLVHPVATAKARTLKRKTGDLNGQPVFVYRPEDILGAEKMLVSGVAPI